MLWALVALLSVSVFRTTLLIRPWSIKVTQAAEIAAADGAIT